jgi:cell division protease FtsH
VSYTFFLTQVDARNVQDVMSTGDTIEGDFKKNVPYDAQGASATTVVQVDRFTTQRPSFADDNLFQKLQTTGVQVNANNPDQAAPLWQQILVGFGPTLFLVGLLVWLGRRAAAGGGLGGVGGIGRARAQRYEPDVVPRTTFADVAGIDEVENEVSEIVDFLRDPDRYRRLGAQIPSGGAEFIEMIVGVGASRVRDLFDQAKKVAPAIIFIDELDAIGRACGGSAAIGGHDEREQTLNQILTEMDGFTGNEGVVVLAATNRPEILDPALLRPGRFDRRVTVSPPDLRGRRQILDVHTRAVPLADNVNLDTVAAATPGMVGADLKNLVNEAALLAARRGHARVEAADFSDALEKVVLPPPSQESPFGLDGVAPATKELIDREARRIVDECHAEAVTTLNDHRHQLDALAHTLLDRETLDEDDASAAAGVPRETAPAAQARGEVPGTSSAPGLPRATPPANTANALNTRPTAGDDRNTRNP